MTLDRRGHWEKIYLDREPGEVSWHQETPSLSLELIRRTRIPKDANLIDVGGGASRLVDTLLDSGFARVAVLDISPRALAYARERLGARAKQANWIVVDITTFVPSETYDLWHDRAVFHFLTEESDRKKYVDCVRSALKPGGALILAAFAPDGPETCSSLPVRRYDARLVRETFGSEFELMREAAESHLTPRETEQKFGYYLLKRKGPRIAAEELVHKRLPG